jgi:Fe-S cluster assembly protein SufB
MSVSTPQDEYQHGFVSAVDNKSQLVGLSEEVVRKISKSRNEPEWLLEFRLDAYAQLQKMTEPQWSEIKYDLDLDTTIFLATQKRPKAQSLSEIDPEILKTYDRLGIPLEEQKRLSGVAVDAVFDSTSVFTTYRKQLAEIGVIFCSFADAVQDYPELVARYLGSVVPSNDNYFTCLNSAVFSDGSFVFVPQGVQCPMDLTSYFRINTEGLGQFERTLIIVEQGGSARYLEGCSAPQFPTSQLHAAVVEIITLDNASVDYATVQNWYPGDEQGKGGVLNFVTKRGLCKGARSRISWTQFETGAAATWKYPSCILMGDESVGEFFSLAITKHYQQADTGTKMIHLGVNTKSRIVSKSIASGHSVNIFRSLVKVAEGATGSRNFSACDSLLFGSDTTTNTYPTIVIRNNSSKVEHEAKSGSVDKTVIEYLASRGLTEEQANNLVVAGYAREVLAKLPLEFALEAQELLKISFEGSVG